MPSYSQTARALTPPLLWNFGKRRLPGLVRALGGHYTHIRFTGNYPSFEAARQASQGYDAPAILARTREALLKVKRGEVRWERDAMVSDSEDMHWPLIACLLRIAAVEKTTALRVVDFGGSLGSTYFWLRPFLEPEISLRWHVVEQAAHVEIGRSDFQNDHLRFADSVDDVITSEPPHVLLMSGVLHYLENPEAFLDQLGGWGFPYMILDRTPLTDRSTHRLTVQHIPKEIYEASYPAWFLSRERILKNVERHYRLFWKIPDTEVWEIDNDAVSNSLYFFKQLPRVGLPPTSKEP